MGTLDVWKSQTVYQTSVKWHFPGLSLSVLFHLIFLHLLVPLKHLLAACLEVTSLYIILRSSKGLLCVINIWVVNRFNVYWANYEHVFLYMFPLYLVYNTTCLVWWLYVKFKRNFDSIRYNYMISWTTRYFNANALIHICYIGHVDLGYMFSFTFWR